MEKKSTTTNNKEEKGQGWEGIIQMVEMLKKRHEATCTSIFTWEAIRAHLLPCLAWSSMMIFSSSGVKEPFFRLGLKWFAHLSLQLLPHLINPQFFCTEFQFPSPCFFTYSIKMASSATVHGPFFKPWLTSFGAVACPLSITTTLSILLQFLLLIILDEFPHHQYHH